MEKKREGERDAQNQRANILINLSDITIGSEKKGMGQFAQRLSHISCKYCYLNARCYLNDVHKVLAVNSTFLGTVIKNISIPF